MTKIKRIDEFVNDIQTNDEASVNDRVMFRKIMKPAKFKGVVTAVFPDLLSDPTGDYKPRNFVMCYDIIGQHSDCDLNVIKMNTVPATPDEYAEILDEIQSRGYENPIVMTPEEQKAFFRKSPRYMNESIVNEGFGDQRNELKKCYLYKGYHEVYISDRPIEGFSNIRPKEYRSFNDAYEAALKLEVDTLFSETLKDEVCDYYGDRDYYEDNKEFFFNPDEPINESRVNEMIDNSVKSEIDMFYKQGKQLLEKLTANIVEILKRHNGEINIGEFEYDGYIDPIMVSVSNNDYGYVSSSVSSVKLNGKSFTLDTDENPKYDAENLNVYEVIDIYDALAMIEEHPEWSEK